MSVTYALKRVFKMDFGRVGKDIARVSEKSGKSRVYTFADMVYCGMKYGAGPLDYDLFEFYNLNRSQRKTYVTRGVNNALVKKYNSREYTHIFDNKDEFNKLFSEFINRDWLTTSDMSFEEFEKFLKGKDEIIYKPIDGTCGRGIEKIGTKGQDAKQLFECLKAKPDGIIEQVIIQNEAISEIYPLAINTIRVVTILKDGKVTPVFSFWRIGNNGKFVDNLNSGGMAAIVDTQSGEITLPAADKNGISYTAHPYTGKDIVGFKIPMWEEIIRVVSAAAKKVPQMGYIGWDIALCDNGIQIIEGNCFPGHDILQLPAYTPDKIGLMSRVEKFLK